MLHNCIAQISAAALRGNIQAIRKRVGSVPLCPAVKANAYGHGLELVLRVLAAERVERIAVANLNEALAARSLGWYRPILCLGAPVGAAASAPPELSRSHGLPSEPGSTNPVTCDTEKPANLVRTVDAGLTGSASDLHERCQTAVAADIQVTISSEFEAQALARVARQWHRSARVQVKVDTGMGRMGILCDEAAETIARIGCCPGIIIEGVYTHFATADEAHADFAREQLARFLKLREQLNALDMRVGAFHAANSAACFRMPEATAGLDLVRPGICLYGYWDGPVAERPAELTPAMRVVSRMAAVRRLPAGHSVGYGQTYTTRRPSVIGVVPIGYADGYRRLLGNNSVMTLPAIRQEPQRTAPVVGRISMDQTTLDLTEAGDVRPGDPVVVIDNDPAAPNSVESIARKLGTITYEVTCLIGRRVRRVAD